MERIDNFFAAIWRPVLRTLCSATGWSNFWWAELILLVSGSVLIVGFLLYNMLPIAVLVIFTVMAILRAYDRLEADTSRDSAFSVDFLRLLVRFRTSGVALALFSAWYVPVIALGQLGVCISLYFVIDFIPARP